MLIEIETDLKENKINNHGNLEYKYFILFKLNLLKII